MAGAAMAADVDRDGLDDGLEQTLLEEFLPRFYVSAGECDGSAAEFTEGAAGPEARARNGTIHGQAFPARPGREERWVELHYYHLWSRDCGRGGHDLDAEHVSALVRESKGRWRAEYWYAGAHEGTVCEVSAARRAGVEARAEVWVSAGKHASFLSQEACNRSGCGGDRCEDPRKMAVERVVNLGERGAPMTGMQWVSMGAWPLQEKMGSDFDEGLLTRLDGADGTIRAAESVRGVQTTLAVGNKPVSALDESATGTGRFLRRAARGVGRFLKWE
jgi:hypothetical protein